MILVVYSYLVLPAASIYRVLIVCSLSLSSVLSLPCAPPVRYTVRKVRVDLF